MLTVSKKQARQFLLIKHGLYDERKFVGQTGMLDFVAQVGSIQFDPIDVCGKNAELVLQSRIEGFKKDWLYDYLYQERVLMDHFDKCLSIHPVSDWPKLKRVRDKLIDPNQINQAMKDAIVEVAKHLEKHPYVSSKDLLLHEKTDGYWNQISLSRAVLDMLYLTGKLAIHHKKNVIKYYCWMDRVLPKEIVEAIDPFATDADYLKWHVLRRIASVGFMWARRSDAFLSIPQLGASMLQNVFNWLLEEEKLVRVDVEGVKYPLYCVKGDRDIFNEIKSHDEFRRLEFIAPLDNLIWDRNLIKELFDFDYKWEIYHTPAKRKYGYYCLPILYGDKFIGRIEMINQKKQKELRVANIWYEEGICLDAKLRQALDDAIQRFARFNDCLSIIDNTKVV